MTIGRNFTPFREFGPAWDLIEITPSDSEPLSSDIRALYVGVSGDVTLLTFEGNERTLENLAAGVFHPVMATQIKATGTTATGIVGVLK